MKKLIIFFLGFNIIGSYPLTAYRYYNTDMQLRDIDKYYSNDLNFNINLCLLEEYINSKYKYNYNKTYVTQFWSHTEKEQLLHDIKKNYKYNLDAFNCK